MCSSFSLAGVSCGSLLTECPSIKASGGAEFTVAVCPLCEAKFATMSTRRKHSPAKPYDETTNLNSSAPGPSENKRSHSSARPTSAQATTPTPLRTAPQTVPSPSPTPWSPPPPSSYRSPTPKRTWEREPTYDWQEWPVDLPLWPGLQVNLVLGGA